MRNAVVSHVHAEFWRLTRPHPRWVRRALGPILQRERLISLLHQCINQHDPSYLFPTRKEIDVATMVDLLKAHRFRRVNKSPGYLQAYVHMLATSENPGSAKYRDTARRWLRRLKRGR